MKLVHLYLVFHSLKKLVEKVILPIILIKLLLNVKILENYILILVFFFKYFIIYISVTFRPKTKYKT